jgi:hypothetical protein
MLSLPALTRLGFGTRKLEPAALKTLGQFKELTQLELPAAGIKADDVRSLQAMPKLNNLGFSYNQLDAETMKTVGTLTRLKALSLRNAGFNESGLANLQSLRELERLELRGSTVTDAGLNHLRGLSNLKNLNLTETIVTAAGVNALQAALPNCKIEWDGAAKTSGQSVNGPPQNSNSQSIDLLALVDPKRDAVKGQWTLTPEGLATTLGVDGSAARLQLPYVAPEEFDFEIEFTPTNGDNRVSQIVAARGSDFLWSVNSKLNGGVKAGVERLDEKSLTSRIEASAMRPEAMLVNGRRYRSRVEVRNGVVRGFLDDEKLTEFKGDFKRLSTQPGQQLPDPRRLGLDVYHRAVTFHKITVREVTGRGTVVERDAKPQ